MSRLKGFSKILHSPPALCSKCGGLITFSKSKNGKWYPVMVYFDAKEEEFCVRWNDWHSWEPKETAFPVRHECFQAKAEVATVKKLREENNGAFEVFEKQHSFDALHFRSIYSGEGVRYVFELERSRRKIKGRNCPEEDFWKLQPLKRFGRPGKLKKIIERWG